MTDAKGTESSIRTAELTITNKLGLHARAAAKLVHTAARFNAEVFIRRDQTEVNAKSIMGVMMLAAAQGATLVIRAEGEDSELAISAIRELIESKFGEQE